MAQSFPAPSRTGSVFRRQPQPSEPSADPESADPECRCRTARRWDRPRSSRAPAPDSSCRCSILRPYAWSPCSRLSWKTPPRPSSHRSRQPHRCCQPHWSPYPKPRCSAPHNPLPSPTTAPSTTGSVLSSRKPSSVPSEPAASRRSRQRCRCQGWSGSSSRRSR